MPALIEEARCRRQALLRVDVVDHDAIAGFDASLEHIAVGHHGLAIETGQCGRFCRKFSSEMICGMLSL